MPLKLRYKNKAGMEFVLRAITDLDTEIRSVESNRSILVNASINRVSLAWDDWLSDLISIHTVMNFLEDYEREFIATGNLIEVNRR